MIKKYARLAVGLCVIALIFTAGNMNAEPVNSDSTVAGKQIMGYGHQWPAEDSANLLSNIDLPPEIRICGVVGDNSGPDLQFPLTRGFDKQLARLTTVEVNSPDVPVLLLLSSNNSTIWQVKTIGDTKVLAAVARGREPQAIMGLPPDIPSIVSNILLPGDTVLSYGQPQDNSVNHSFDLKRFSVKNFNQEPDILIEPLEGLAVCGWRATPGQDTISYGDINPQSLNAYGDLQAQLDAAVEAKLIRRAKPDDLKKYLDAYTMDGRLFMENKKKNMLADAYVVESPAFVLPDELDHLGDPSTNKVYTVFIPSDLSLPQGPVESARILFMEDGACLGRHCGSQAGTYSASGKRPAPHTRMPKVCSFDNLTLPEDTKIYAGGLGYLPKNSVPQGHTGSRRIEVTVNSPQNPVALILGAQGSHEWSFDIKPGTQVAAVISGGGHDSTQTLLNLPKDIPVLNYGKLPCIYLSFSAENFDKIDSVSQTVYGKSPDRGFAAVDGKLIIDPSVPPRMPESLGQNEHISAMDNSAIKEALEKGLIQPASIDTQAAWFRMHAKKSGAASLMEAADYYKPILFPVYEISSSDFIITKEMTQTGTIGFFLPENIKLPEGDPGRAIIYFLDNGVCWGRESGCEEYPY